jgi:drug/metabolite transporter (DMT)-like permease
VRRCEAALMDLRASAALLFTVVIWGIGPVFLRTLSVDLGAGDHLVIRYSIVSVIYIAILAATGGWRMSWRDWPRLAIISFIGMAGYNLGSAFGFERIGAGIGSLIIGTQPLLIAVLGSLIGKERLSTAVVVGLALAFLGTALLVWNDVGVAQGGYRFLTGALLVFLCGVAWAIYVVVSKPLIRTYGSLSVTALSIVLASIAMIALLAKPSTVTTATAMTLPNWLDMAFIVGPSTLLAAITWNYGAARLPSAAAGAFLYFVPVIGVAAGVLVLGEKLTAGMLAGGALILVGVAIAQFAPLLRKTRLAPSAAVGGRKG